MKIKPKIKIRIILILALVILVAFPLTAHAQTVTSQMSTALSGILTSLSAFLTLSLKVLQRILWPIFLAIGGLLNNDILFGYGMEQRLLEVWVVMRNIVNVIFVVVLLGVALFNVLAFKPDSEFALKTFLPKFAIALIAVNFSYIGMKIILDVTNVATNAVFTLPSSISKEVASPQLASCPDAGAGNYESCTVKNQDAVTKICTAYYGTVDEYKQRGVEVANLAKDKDQKDQAKAIQESTLCAEGAGKTYTLSKNGFKFFNQYNSRNAGLIMAIQFMKVMDVDKISAATTKDASGLAFNLLFSVILYIVYGAAYVALFVVLLARLVALWLFIALSPFVALTFVIGDMLPQAAGDIKTKFFKNAFAPVLMGIPLTIGYVLLEAFRQSKTATQVGLGTSFQMVKLEASGISDLQSMIIAFAAVAVVWIGVFAAAEGTIAERFTEQIKDKVTALGSGATNLLKLIPIIPAGEGGKGISYKQAMGKWKKPFADLERKYGTTKEKSMTEKEVRDVRKRGRKSTVEQGREAVLGGLSSKGGQKESYKLLQQWKNRGTGKQQTFSKGVLAKIAPKDIEALKKGELKAAGQGRLRSIPLLHTPASTAGNRKSTAGTKSGGGTTAGGASQTGISGDVSTINNASGYGIAVSAPLAAASRKYTNAMSTGDADGAKAAEAEINKNHSAEVAKIKNASKSKIELSSVETSAKGIKDPTKPDSKAIDALSKKLRVADASLKKNKVGDDERKKILGRVLQKATGNKAAELLKDAKISKYAS